MNEILDLWPKDIGSFEKTAPKTILKSQASLLATKTNNLVRGKVVTKSLGPYFRHYFYLVAPALENYTYKVFEIQHGIKLYPVKIMKCEAFGKDLSAKNQVMFCALLRKIFAHSKTLTVIRAIVAQSE